MLTEFLSILEGSAPAVFLRGSTWAYPLVNAAHILGISLLIGAIVAFDLRLIGAWRTVPLDPVSRILVPVAAAGLGLAAVAGFLLFSVKAGDYAVSALFRAKMALLALGLLNVLVYHVANRRPGGMTESAGRLSATVSLVVWPSVLVLGRLVGYF